MSVNLTNLLQQHPAAEGVVADGWQTWLRFFPEGETAATGGVKELTFKVTVFFALGYSLLLLDPTGGSD